MPISKRTKVVTAIVGLPVVLLALCVVVLLLPNYGDRLAVYDGFSVGSRGSSFRDVNIDSRDGFPKLFIKAPDGKTYALKDLPESVAEKYIGDRSDHADHPVHPRPAVSYSIFQGPHLEYENGNLRHASFTRPDGFEFAPTMRGPFLKLPATRKDLIAVFGEPAEWKRRGPVPGPAW